MIRSDFPALDGFITRCQCAGLSCFELEPPHPSTPRRILFRALDVISRTYGRGPPYPTPRQNC